MAVHINKYRLKMDDIEGGRWIEFGEGLEFKLAHIGSNKCVNLINKKREALIESKLEELKKDNEDATVDDVKITTDEFNQITCEVIAEAVILDWRGLVDEDGEIPFNRELALDIMTNDEFVELATMIFTHAKNRDNYKYEITQKAKKK
ncbi:hypothetical protein [Idiomarina piscisalsi]|uniref:Uncharacterized protein n=1 Tax=Idiomarina piscisalsi TaxID=1096243 RepID=A0A432YXG5_9GAMM|nr:hypothetical protein [Idiomarina piscisalsi]RUO67991.1 hypothetical protein CWI73_03805 [Idiomarina piscisalsi]